MLISNAEIYQSGPGSVRIADGQIKALGELSPSPGEHIIDAAGGALLPGLNDHHLHLLSLAAAGESVHCGPPQVASEVDLIAALRRYLHGTHGGHQGAWLRGVGYHESVAGDIDRAWLDAHTGSGPARIQHRSGRLWMVNSAGLREIAGALQHLPPDQRPRISEDGRLYDIDPVLHLLPDAAMPNVDGTSRRLAGFGVTGFTDMTPGNDAATLGTFGALQRDGHLLQHVRVAGRLDLPLDSANSAASPASLGVGATKVHLHEAHLPSYAELCATIAQSHARHREVAIHCVTEVELVFALAALRDAQVLAGDRIEHASVTPPALLEQIKESALTVVTQPNFVHERGDAYLADIACSEHAWLYRCGSFLRGGIALAGGTDAPFGHCDPWRAMAAAVRRRTASNRALGASEAITAEQALDLFLGSLERPALPRRVTVGARADLCLLDCPWSEARLALTSSRVRATVRGGELIYDGVNKAPI